MICFLLDVDHFYVIKYYKLYTISDTKNRCKAKGSWSQGRGRLIYFSIT